MSDKAKSPAKPEAATTAPKAAAGGAAKAGAASGKQRHRRPRNWPLGNTGLMRFSQASMYRRRAIYKKKRVAKPAKPREKRLAFVEKPVGGEKNGQKRRVPKHRLPRYYPTEDAPRRFRSNRKPVSKHVHTLRPGIKAGNLLILVAGKHKGKRVVYLKQLPSGLLLVTGPYTFNGCPLRRINQTHVLPTSVRLDISKVKLPENINDTYFKKAKGAASAKRGKKGDAELFDTKKEKFVPNEQRKADQKTVDSQLCALIKAHPEQSVLKKYLRSLFSLKKGQYPHSIKF